MTQTICVSHITLFPGSRYTGDFESDFFHGFGRYTYVCGSVYEGEFSRHRRQGFGKLFDQKGKLLYSGMEYFGLISPISTDTQ